MLRICSTKWIRYPIEFEMAAVVVIRRHLTTRVTFCCYPLTNFSIVFFLIKLQGSQILLIYTDIKKESSKSEKLSQPKQLRRFGMKQKQIFHQVNLKVSSCAEKCLFKQPHSEKTSKMLVS